MLSTYYVSDTMLKTYFISFNPMAHSKINVNPINIAEETDHLAQVPRANK